MFFLGANFFIPYRNLPGLAIPILLACVALTLFSFLARKQCFDVTLAERLHKDPQYSALALIILSGIAIRALWVFHFPSEQFSDFQSYWDAALRILNEGRYYYSDKVHGGELVAWRPVGFPGILAAMIEIFGDDPSKIPVGINIAAYVLASLLIYRVVAVYFPAPISLLPVVLLTLYPESIAASALAASEPLSLALLSGVFSFLVVPIRGQPLPSSFLAGILLGVLVLIKPGFMLLPLGIAILLAMRFGVSRGAAISLVFVVASVLVVAPWTARNYQLLGKVIPVSTNGGDVFYRANNPLASGSFTEKGEIDLDQYRYDEVLWSEKGYEYGKKWIAENPVSFVALAFRKQSFFFDSGTFVYYALERGLGRAGIQYKVMRWISLLYWWAMLLLSAIGILVELKRARPRFSMVLAAAIFLYVLGVHSVFESQPRHAVPLFFIVSLFATSGISALARRSKFFHRALSETTRSSETRAGR